MNAFRHSDDSPPDAAWLAGRLADCAWLDTPGAGDHVLVLAAHPDDETLGAGGLIASAVRRDARVTIVVATDGDASHPASPTHTPQMLARRRRAEVQNAVRELGVTTDVHFLGLPDGRLDEYTEALQAQVEFFARSATHVVSPWEHDRHPDHEACARAGTLAAGRHRLQCWQYPIWAWHWGDPESDGGSLPWASTRLIAIAPAEQATKRRAIAAHVSQHSALSNRPGDEAILDPGMVAHFDRPFETFVVVEADDVTAPGFFDRLYSRDDDPWGLDTRFYEVRKRSLLIDALPRPRFGRAFEPGCATGLITTALASRCDEVIAWDVAQRALDQTSARLAHSPNVRVERGAVPDEWPDGVFDLVVVSEVGYYCPDLNELARKVWGSLAADGTLVACHWRHPAVLHPHTADAVHDVLGHGREPVVAHVEADFLLHVWTGTGQSVAVETGLVPDAT
jgi:LmbE family N-acetylglucosaminyl deacetylase